MTLMVFLSSILLGLFFAISGFHKLFNPQRHQALVQTLKNDKIPFVGFNQYWVPIVEFSAGIGLITGIMWPLPILGLMTICLVATVTDGIKRINDWQPIDRFDAIDDLLYLQEFWYIIVMFLIIENRGLSFVWY